MAFEILANMDVKLSLTGNLCRQFSNCQTKRSKNDPNDHRYDVQPTDSSKYHFHAPEARKKDEYKNGYPLSFDGNAGMPPIFPYFSD